MQINHDRIEKYLNDIASEVDDTNSILSRPDEQILGDRHLLKSLKYSVVVIAEAIGGVLQHILAKRHNVAIGGYVEAFVKSREYRIVPEDLIERLLHFSRFRNMLVHQYWKVDDRVFLENIRAGIEDFRSFTKIIKDMSKADLSNSSNDK